MTKLILSFLLAGAAMPVGAQQRPGPGGPPPADTARMQQMQAREGDDLALLLGLRPAQRPALDAFLASGRPPMSPPGGDRPGSPPVPGATPTPPGFEQQLTMDEARLAERVRVEREHIAAARAFYGQLDARQKTLFDALMRWRHGPGGPGGDRPGPGGPGLHGPGPHGPGPHGPAEAPPPPPQG